MFLYQRRVRTSNLISGLGHPYDCGQCGTKLSTTYSRNGQGARVTRISAGLLPFAISNVLHMPCHPQYLLVLKWSNLEQVILTIWYVVYVTPTFILLICSKLVRLTCFTIRPHTVLQGAGGFSRCEYPTKVLGQVWATTLQVQQSWYNIPLVVQIFLTQSPW